MNANDRELVEELVQIGKALEEMTDKTAYEQKIEDACPVLAGLLERDKAQGEILNREIPEKPMPIELSYQGEPVRFVFESEANWAIDILTDRLLEARALLQGDGE